MIYLYKLAFILFVGKPGAQTIGNIAVYGSAKQLVINSWFGWQIQHSSEVLPWQMLFSNVTA